MQVTMPPPLVTATKLTGSALVSRRVAVAESSHEGVKGSVDFTRITPRRLNAYLDEMIANDRIDPLDATVLGGVFSAEEYEKSPDRPVNLKAELEGTMKFHENHGDTLLATWYAGLMDRLETMEKQSMHVSVYA